MSFFNSGDKSKQGGTITIPQSGAVTATATLSPAVDTTKTRLRLLGFHSPELYGDVYIRLTNGTTVTAYCEQTTNGDHIVSWELTEKYR